MCQGAKTQQILLLSSKYSISLQTETFFWKQVPHYRYMQTNVLEKDFFLNTDSSFANLNKKVFFLDCWSFLQLYDPGKPGALPL